MFIAPVIWFFFSCLPISHLHSRPINSKGRKCACRDGDYILDHWGRLDVHAVSTQLSDTGINGSLNVVFENSKKYFCAGVSPVCPDVTQHQGSQVSWGVHGFGSCSYLCPWLKTATWANQGTASSLLAWL